MPIEIGNYTIANQPLEPGKEAKTGEAQLRATNAEKETRQAVTTLTATECASTVDVTDTSRVLQLLDAATSQAPVVDPNKIAIIKAKIQSNNLNILKTNTKEQLASAENIAHKILALDAALPQIPTTTLGNDV